MTVDSVAGAFVQARYRDPVTARWVETPHDKEESPVQGWRWMDNEAVNLLGTSAGALAAILFW
jgi:uncharacterized membrane protein